MCNDLFMYQLKYFYILKVKRNSNYQKWAHLLSFCCLTFVSTFITTRSFLLLLKPVGLSVTDRLTFFCSFPFTDAGFVGFPA